MTMASRLPGGDPAGKAPVCRLTASWRAPASGNPRGHESLPRVAVVVAFVGASALLLFPERDPAVSFPDDPPADGALSEATVGQILRDPAAFEDQAVLVRGAAALPLGREGGFVLESDGNQILVYAPGGLPRIDPGKTVGIRGEVVRFTEPAAELLGDALDDPGQLSGVPTETGDPYPLLRALAPGQTAAGAPPPDLRRARERLTAVVAHPGIHYGDAVTVAGEVARAGRATSSSRLAARSCSSCRSPR